jgi:hypothetical protein
MAELFLAGQAGLAPEQAEPAIAANRARRPYLAMKSRRGKAGASRHARFRPLHTTRASPLALNAAALAHPNFAGYRRRLLPHLDGYIRRARAYRVVDLRVDLQ